MVAQAVLANVVGILEAVRADVAGAVSNRQVAFVLVLSGIEMGRMV
jgi:hypothetical protein